MSPEVIEQSQSTNVPTVEPSYTPPVDDASARSESSMPESQKVDEGEPKLEPKVKLPASIKPPTKSGRFQARISDLVSRRDSVERENSQLRERLSRMQGIPSKVDFANRETPSAGHSAKTGGQSGGTVVLNPEDFPTYGEYVTALVSQTLEQKEASRNSERAKNDYETYKQERMATFNEKAEPLAAEYGEGFWDAITDENLPISEAMADAVLELDDIGPYTMLWLAAHRNESAKIAKMNPRAATIAIGRLAAQLDFEIKGGSGSVEGNTDTQKEQSSAQVPPQNVAPQAPRPTPVPTPRGSTPASLDGSPQDRDDVDTWLRKETDRLRRQNPNARFYGAR